MLTTIKIETGVFDVLWNGEKTIYQIINGSRGYNGNGAKNMYGITYKGNVKWIGSLSSCKGIVSAKLSAKK